MRQQPIPLCDVYKSSSWRMHLGLQVGQAPTGTFGEEELAGQVYLGDHQVCCHLPPAQHPSQQLKQMPGPLCVCAGSLSLASGTPVNSLQQGCPQVCCSVPSPTTIRHAWLQKDLQVSQHSLPSCSLRGDRGSRPCACMQQQLHSRAGPLRWLRHADGLLQGHG